MRNEYDNEHFFEEYAKMPRSRGGLAAAGEWHQLRPLFPPLEGKRVLDLGAATAGTASLPPNRARHGCWGWT